MKYFAIILSLFTVILSGIPCDDEVVDSTEISVVTPAHHNDSDVHIDFCSPFDTCDCCATPISVTEIFVAQLAPEVISTTLNYATVTAITTEFADGIFQPPRV